jgi:hypothetical protein
MNIRSYRTIPESEFLARLKRTRLRGHGQPYLYENASLEILEAVDPARLAPAQRYVLREDCATVESLYRAFLERSVDLFALRGALFFVPEGQEEEIPFTPPIVEESLEPDGRRPLLINDGIHRVYTAKKLGLPINVALIRQVPPEYPYYALALQNGWDEVEELDVLPDNYLKKTYRDPEGYKALFRDFNEVFPGVQKQRKQSNPKHLTA